MKKSTIAIGAVVGVGVLYVLSKQSSSGSGSGGSSLLDNFNPFKDWKLPDALTNIKDTGTNYTDAMKQVSEMLNNLASAGNKGAESINNLMNVPDAISKTVSNAGTNVAQFVNNVPTYITKTDVTKPFDKLANTEMGLVSTVKNKLTHLW